MIGLRQILFVLGIILLIRFIGKIMSARRNVNEQNQYQKNKNRREFEQEKAKQDLGKTYIEKIDKRSIKDSDFTDFEEID